MSSAGLVQHAVRRDLARAHVLLTALPRLEPARREALARHLVWLSRLELTDAPDLREAFARLEVAAQRLYSSAEPEDRARVAGAVERLARSQADRDTWVRPGALAALCRQLPWLVDGLDARAAEHVIRSLTPRGGRALLRQRSDIYRFRSDALWGGTPAERLPVQRVPGQRRPQGDRVAV